MIAASTNLPSPIWSAMAASSIHGTGAQNFSSAMRNGCCAVSGNLFGPNFSKIAAGLIAHHVAQRLSSTAC
jgi:hypothetical protein